ncbi:MAG: HAMP domain-containing sensor histidine kinase [Usitatibacter sp.]
MPRSLFGRLVAVLMVGLLTAQLLSFAIHMHERSQLLMEASGMQSAQRIADIVRLLESLAPPERARVAGVLSAPPMAIRLAQPALSPVAAEPERAARAALFGAFLRRALGDEWPMEVAVTEGAAGPQSMRGMPGMPGGPMGRGPNHQAPHPGMPYFTQPALSFVAQVRLRDGTLVTFDTRQPAHSESWPYRLLASLAVLLAGVLAVSLLAVRWVTRPLDVLAGAAEALGRNIDRPPLAESGPVEVVRAARAFNTMQARLARYIGERTRVLAAMSHDLKTPITRLRLRADLLDDPGLRSKFSGDLAEMESMVGAALDFLRGLENSEPVKPIDVAALLESLQADASEAGARVEFAAGPIAPYAGRPQALKRCLSNLLDNAIKYGGGAKITAEDGPGQLVIRILDAGPGMPEEELERVFDPYYRLEPSRSRETGGTGLGLTIARSIARSHGGDVVLRNRPEGGVAAELTLARSTQASAV